MEETRNDMVPAHPTHGAIVAGGQLPALIEVMGPKAAEEFYNFFAAAIRNINTRRAYMGAVKTFCQWLEERNVKSLADARTLHVAAYIEQLTVHQGKAPASVKLSLSAIRMLFDYLVTRQVVDSNPAAAVKGPKHSSSTGKTPILTSGEASMFLRSIGTSEKKDLRDKALIATMLYTFARIGAVLKLQVKDYSTNYGRRVLVLQEKGGKEHQMPVSAKLAEILDAWITAAGIAGDPNACLFPSMRDASRPIAQQDAYAMVRKRAEDAEIKTKIGNHSMRGTGITTYLQNGGTVERAQAMAAHSDPRTTRIYDRRSIDQLVDDVERIVF